MMNIYPLRQNWCLQDKKNAVGTASSKSPLKRLEVSRRKL